MLETTFLLQSGDVMHREKVACACSRYPVHYSSYEGLEKIDTKKRLQYVPVGSVEFTRRYCHHMGLFLPEEYTYPDVLRDFVHRDIRQGILSEALDYQFVKPWSLSKLFTGCTRAEVPGEIPDDTPVWICDPVPFGAEYRFYIQDYATGPVIQGWSRYDTLLENSPSPDVAYVELMAQVLHDSIGPGAYCLDIGWRADLNRFDLVEFNDAWSLGYYDNSDKNSNPPSRQQYADMLVSRWRQTLFCNLLDEQDKVYEL